jgi:2,4-dienoyl-CoA reductase-like NADH-dependent reductase (Old Yellow Enzyme family)
LGGLTLKPDAPGEDSMATDVDTLEPCFMTTLPSLLSQPLRIRSWQFRNRVVMPPMVSVRDIAAQDGVDWYRRHAEGGPGLVIIEATGVPRFSRDLSATALRPLVDAIHQAGALAAIQLFPLDFGTDREVGQLSRTEIADIVQQYRRATRICRDAGMDGVEPHGAHGYLLNRFFSPAENPRHDDYGQTPAGRMRFGLEIVRGIRSEVGEAVLLLYRHTPVKDGSYGCADSLAFAAELVAAGVDVLDLSPSSLVTPGDHAAPFRHLGVPVIAVGGLDAPGRAEEALREGRADLVAIGRGQIADPNWARKACAGEWDQITVCTKCNKLCFGNLRKRLPIACTEWPEPAA